MNTTSASASDDDEARPYLRGQSLHALATGRSGCTHFALAISTTAPSASLEASHASGHLKSSALTEVSLAAARHAVERLGWRVGVSWVMGKSRRRSECARARTAARRVEPRVDKADLRGARGTGRGPRTHLRDADADGRADGEESGGGGHGREGVTVRCGV